MSKKTNIQTLDIEAKLNSIWEAEEQQGKIRASLFTLLVYVKDPKRTPYIKQLVSFVMDQFPCRVIFIEDHPSDDLDMLKIKVSARTIGKKELQIICDEIDIEVSGHPTERLPYIILPHLLPDLPIYLLWPEMPDLNDTLFPYLQNLSDRLIIDSECSENLQQFSQTLLANKEKYHWEIADLNWVRLEGWREVLKNIFNASDKIEQLSKSTQIYITYNSTKSPCFFHQQIQTHYLHAWLAAQLGWHSPSLSQKDDYLHIHYQRPDQGSTNFTLSHLSHPKAPPGSILAIDIATEGGYRFLLSRQSEEGLVTVKILSADQCEVPHIAYLTHSTWEYTFVREICYKETSMHYCNMLKVLSQIKGIL